MHRLGVGHGTDRADTAPVQPGDGDRPAIGGELERGALHAFRHRGCGLPGWQLSGFLSLVRQSVAGLQGRAQDGAQGRTDTRISVRAVCHRLGADAADGHRLQAAALHAEQGHGVGQGEHRLHLYQPVVQRRRLQAGTPAQSRHQRRLHVVAHRELRRRH